MYGPSPTVLPFTDIQVLGWLRATPPCCCTTYGSTKTHGAVSMVWRNATNALVRWKVTALALSTVTAFFVFCMICIRVEFDPGEFCALFREFTSPAVTPESLR